MATPFPLLSILTFENHKTLPSVSVFLTDHLEALDLIEFNNWIPTTFIHWQIWVIANLCAAADYLLQKKEEYNVPVGYVEPASGVPGNKAK